jgi:hypothetical protein
LHLCPLCQRPLCNACQARREELGRQTLSSVRLAAQDVATRRRSRQRRSLGKMARRAAAGAVLPLLGLPVLGWSCLTVGALLAEVLAGQGLLEWLNERQAEGSADHKIEDPAAEIAELAPCSHECWRLCTCADLLRHSEVALYYGLFCSRCLKRARFGGINARFALACIIHGQTARLRAEERPPRCQTHPQGSDARGLAARLGMRASGQAG